MRTSALSLALLAICLVSGNARATILDLSGSTLEIHFGNQLVITVDQATDPVPVFVSSGLGSFVVPSGLFSDMQTLPRELFTGGPPLVVGMRFTLSNLSGTFEPGGGGAGGFGGVAPLAGGWALIPAGGGFFFPTTPLSPVGQGGVALAGAAALMITVTGAPWTTGVASVTAITAPSGSGFVNTVTLAGFDNRTVAHAGTLRLVSPLRLTSNAIFPPAAHFFVQNLVFVPEPGPLILALAGAGAALWAGRHRTR